MSSPIARRYATALIELAQEQSQMPKMRRDLETVAAAWDTSPELRETFRNPAMNVETRKAIVSALAQRMGLSPTTKNALLLMTDNGRFEHISDVSAEFVRLSEKASGAVVAEVTTAKPMPPTYFTRLKAELEKTTGQKVTLVTNEDPSLIAGVITRIGDKVYDGSVRNRLEQLQETLLA